MQFNRGTPGVHHAVRFSQKPTAGFVGVFEGVAAGCPVAGVVVEVAAAAVAAGDGFN